MTKAQFRSVRQRNAKIVQRLRHSSVTLEALGAEYGLTRQRIQQSAKRAGRRRVIFSRMGDEL
jgi:DNA-directed RNA polymerase sigma subunit (sigma70/sigma32)